MSIGTTETFEFTPPEELEQEEYYDPFVVNEYGNVDLEVQNLVITGIATVGLGSTSSPQLNSQMSFELTDNDTLTVRVKGTDGITRFGTVALTWQLP